MFDKFHVIWNLSKLKLFKKHYFLIFIVLDDQIPMISLQSSFIFRHIILYVKFFNFRSTQPIDQSCGENSGGFHDFQRKFSEENVLNLWKYFFQNSKDILIEYFHCFPMIFHHINKVFFLWNFLFFYFCLKVDWKIGRTDIWSNEHLTERAFSRIHNWPNGRLLSHFLCKSLY